MSLPAVTGCEEREAIRAEGDRPLSNTISAPIRRESG